MFHSHSLKRKVKQNTLSFTYKKKGPKKFRIHSIFSPHSYEFRMEKQFSNKKNFHEKKINDNNTRVSNEQKKKVIRTFINTLKYYRIRAKTVCVNKNNHV